MKVTIEINSVADIQNAVTKTTEILGLIRDLDLEIDNVDAEPEKVYPIGKSRIPKGADYDIDKKQIPENLINIINYFKTIPYYLNCGWLFRFPDEEESECCAMLYHNDNGSIYYNTANHIVYFGGFTKTEEKLLYNVLTDLYDEMYK